MNDVASPQPQTFLSRAVAVTAIAAGFVVAGLVAYYAIHAIFLILAGLLLAIFLHRVSGGISRGTGIGYGWALAAVLVVIFGLAIGLVLYAVPVIAQQAGQLQGQLASAANQALDQLRQYEIFRSAMQQVNPQRLFSGMGGQTARFVGQTFSGIIGALGSAMVILFVGIYFAAQPNLYLRGVTALAPPRRRARFQEVLKKTGDTLWGVLLGRMISMAIIGTCAGIGLYFLGVPFALLLAVLTALLEFIPYLGPILAMLPPLLLALQKSPQTALYVLLLYGALQLAESYLISPLVQRRQSELPPVITIAAIVAMGILTGPLGVLLAMPLAAAAMVLVREFYVVDLLGDSTAGESEQA